jgi:hypothetical protein
MCGTIRLLATIPFDTTNPLWKKEWLTRHPTIGARRRAALRKVARCLAPLSPRRWGEVLFSAAVVILLLGATLVGPLFRKFEGFHWLLASTRRGKRTVPVTANRIMVQRLGRARPLSFDSRGVSAPSPVGSATRWAGLPIEAHEIGSYEGRGESGPVDGECGLLAITEGQIELVVRRGGREVQRVVRAGSTFLLSGQDRSTVLRMTGPARVLAVHLPPEWFHPLSLDRLPAGFGQTRFLGNDVTVLSLVCAMRDEVARGAATGRLFADSLSTALLSYLVQHTPPSASRVRGRLSDGECHQLRGHILDRLGEDLSLAELAARVGRGSRHFSTLARSERRRGATPSRSGPFSPVLDGHLRDFERRGNAAGAFLGNAFPMPGSLRGVPRGRG